MVYVGSIILLVPSLFAGRSQLPLRQLCAPRPGVWIAVIMSGDDDDDDDGVPTRGPEYYMWIMYAQKMNTRLKECTTNNQDELHRRVARLVLQSNRAIVLILQQCS